METNELRHYGIPGQKWGVRRFQNSDGTRTEAGKERYRDSADEADPREASSVKKMVKKSEAQKEAERQKKNDVKNRGTLTNAQLKEKIERLKLEKDLRELTKGELSYARRFVEDVLKEVGKKTLTTALTGAALYGMKAAADKKFDRKQFGEAIFNGGAKKK